MSPTKATNQANTTKAHLAAVLWEVFDYWYNQLPDEDISNAESGNRTKKSEIKTKQDFYGFEDAVVTTFKLPKERLRRWLDGKHLAQRGNWAKLLAALKTQNVPEEKREALTEAYGAAKQAEYNLAMEDHVAPSAHIAAPASSAAAVPMPVTSPATAQATPAAPPAPAPLRFLPDHTTPKAPLTPPWLTLVLHEPAPEEPNQLVFSINYQPKPHSVPSEKGQPPLRFQLTLREARVAPNWGAVTWVKDSIKTSNANPVVTFGAYWTVTLPQQVNGSALDHFVAALLQARAPGDKLTLTVFAERESIGVTRLDGSRKKVNREAVIAQALKMLGFEGDERTVILDTGAVIATKETE